MPGYRRRAFVTQFLQGHAVVDAGYPPLTAAAAAAARLAFLVTIAAMPYTRRARRERTWAVHEGVGVAEKTGSRVRSSLGVVARGCGAGGERYRGQTRRTFFRICWWA